MSNLTGVNDIDAALGNGYAALLVRHTAVLAHTFIAVVLRFMVMLTAVHLALAFVIHKQSSI